MPPEQLKKLNNLKERIIALLKREYPDPVTVTQISQYLGIVKVQKHLKPLVASGEVIKTDNGGYVLKTKE